jgi:hypothetical protein
MARVQVNDLSQPEKLQVVAQPNVATIRTPDAPTTNSALQLADALGVTSQSLNRFNAEHEERKTQQQLSKVEWYAAQFRKDGSTGAVSEAQVKERFPETVPLIAARISESIGLKEGREKFASIYQEIQGNDALRYDSQAREAFITQKRAEMLNEVGEGNDFYGNGIVKGIDNELKQYGELWQRETAAYHGKVQEDAYSNEVRSALLTGGDLTSVDSKWGKSSSLDNLERKKMTVETAIGVAFETDRPDLLDNIPDIFMNAENKEKLAKAKVQITDKRMTEFRNAQYLESVKRDQDLRNAKQEILTTVTSGEKLDVTKYRNNPEAYAYALQAWDMPVVSENASVAYSSQYENNILTLANVGNGKGVNEYIDEVSSNPYMNPKEKKSLIDKLPKLVEGQIAMNDPMVKSVMTDRINPRLEMLEKSPLVSVQQLISGRNIRAEVMKTYNSEIQRHFRAYEQDNGKWPTGQAKLDLVDKATERTEKVLEQLSKIDGGSTEAPKQTTRGNLSPPNSTKPSGTMVINGVSVTKLN